MANSLTALFAGPSGTGKTTAAEVIAAESDKALNCLDLAVVMSKYVGETEKNLDRLFNAAKHQGTMLLFDEGDALFGRRSEVRDSDDRYANIDTAHLLQRLEELHGVAILATDLRHNIDDAFLHRLLMVIKFPLPDAQERRRLWQRALALTGANSFEAASLDRVAEHFPLTGGDIERIVRHATRLATANQHPVALPDLLEHIEEVKVDRTPEPGAERDSCGKDRSC